jgi:hypothetical protein
LPFVIQFGKRALFSFTPWLQPGGGMLPTSRNRFNGFKVLMALDERVNR